MALASILAKLWKKPKESPFWKDRLITWRTQGALVKIEDPTRPDRAHALGYKAKPGFVLVRARIDKGTRRRPRVKKGRKPLKIGTKIPAKKSKQWILEERVARKYKNLEILNSYWVGEDGKHHWYEVILVDKNHPQILADKSINWIAESQHRGRVFRGLTGSGKKSRGLLNKGKGAEKLRPSQAVHRGRGK
ncbi:MAG: 50S ribosomal protein L15e [Candidatus Aenigmarchaeota archaeon]|nr:50S ribosomal protein L15e [Candidatus Aenigmarchaeota archaeon]